MTTGNPVPVLMTVRELNLGGIERDVAKIATHLDPARFEPHVASYYSGGFRFEELRAAGIPYLNLPVRSLASLAAARAAWAFRAYVRKHRIRVVHAWDASAIFVVPLARLLRVPAVFSSMLGSRDLLDRRSRSQLRFTDRLVDSVVVNCDAMRKHLIEDEGVPGDRIEICYNGVDTTQFYPARTAQPPELEGASLVIGALCALRPEKSLGLLQEAFVRVRRLDSRMKLLIVGDGPELPKLRENSVRLGIEDASIFSPATALPAEYFRAIDIFVLSSVSEAFSNALLEAMACGCCCVGSRVGGTPEMIGAEERGALFSSGDVGELARKLEELALDAARRRDLGVRAARFAKEHLSIETAAERIAEIYESRLRRRGAKAAE